MEQDRVEASRLTAGSASYVEVGIGYLEARQLKKSAGWVLLTAMGVAAVISGYFFGWQYGLVRGGFGGLAIASLIVASMYACMVFSIAEMSAAMPHAGGFYGFTRSTFGPSTAFLNSSTDMVEYVVTPAVIVSGIAAYADLIIDLPNWMWWTGFYVVFVGINAWGTELSFKVSMVVAGLSLVILLVVLIGIVATGSFDGRVLTNVPSDGSRFGTSPFLPGGVYGIWAAIPFAMWFFLPIEQLSLSAEESHDPGRDIPRSLIAALTVLTVLAGTTLVLNSGIKGGPREVGASEAPLFDAMRSVFGEGIGSRVLAACALVGLAASFHSIIYAYGRVLFAASRSGYISRSISRVTTRNTPARALVLGGVVGLALTFVLDRFGSSSVGEALLTMAVFGAAFSYVLIMWTYVVWKRRTWTGPRPYRSPLGITGGWVGLVLAAVAMSATAALDENRPGVIATALVVVSMFGYYWFFSRHRLVAAAPEEAVAFGHHHDPKR